MEERILLSVCHMCGAEKEWVEKAFASNWVAPLGPNVDEFEHRLERYLSAPAVTALSSGTAAIHLGLLLAGVKPGDDVVCQSFTFAASANPVKYLGANPVFVDSEPGTWNMSPTDLEEAIVDRHKATGRYPAAIVPVHLYGMPAMMDEILAVADRYGIPVVEDAAEALGSEYKGKKCGALGLYGALSFNGNKIITTSGGGALVCPDRESADKAVFFATQAREKRPYYYHEEIGYNYRLSNVCAAIGCGQMEALKDRVERRRAIRALYAELLADTPEIEIHDNPSPDIRSNFWLTTALLKKEAGMDPDTLRRGMESRNIETRLLWRPMHMQPVFADAPFYGGAVCESIYSRGLCLPSGSSLTDTDIERVAGALKEIISKR